MKKLTLFFVLAALAITTQAGVGFKIGVGVGLSVAKIKDKYYSDRNKSMLAYDVAIPMEIKVSKYFAIQPEIHFIQKGFALENYGMSGVDKIFRRRNYIEFPVLLKGIMPIGDKTYLTLYTGAGVGYALTNKQVLKLSAGGKEKEKFPFDTNVEDDNIAYNKLDVIIPFGMGFERELTDKISFYTDLRWHFDVTNNIRYNVKPDPTPSYKYRNFIFSIGCNFIAKQKN